MFPEQIEHGRKESGLKNSLMQSFCKGGSQTRISDSVAEVTMAQPIISSDMDATPLMHNRHFGEESLFTASDIGGALRES